MNETERVYLHVSIRNTSEEVAEQHCTFVGVIRLFNVLHEQVLEYLIRVRAEDGVQVKRVWNHPDAVMITTELLLPMPFHAERLPDMDILITRERQSPPMVLTLIEERKANSN